MGVCVLHACVVVKKRNDFLPKYTTESFLITYEQYKMPSFFGNYNQCVIKFKKKYLYCNCLYYI